MEVGGNRGNEHPLGEDLSRETLIYALRVWLEQHPGALVAAVTADGRPAAMPPGVPLLSSHQIDGRPLLSLVADQEKARVVAAFNEAFQHGVSSTKVTMADGTEVVDLHYVDLREAYGVLLRLVVPDESGKAGGTGQQLRAEELLPSRPRLAVIEKDDRSRIRSIDEATTILLGWSRSEMVGCPTLDFIHPDDHARAIDNWMEMIGRDVRHAVRLRYRTKTGGWIWLETSNQLSYEPTGQRYVVCQLIDISEEMAATEALRYNEQVLRRLAETVPVGLAELAPDRSFRYANSSFCSLVGGQNPDCIGRLLACLDTRDAAALETAITNVVEKGIDADIDVRLEGSNNASGQTCRVALRSVTDDAQVLGALICIMDVTDLKIQAATDPLTGVHNRASIFEELASALAREVPVGVVFLDVDRFKSINDTFGHDAGDAVLTGVAAALTAAVREGDAVGRVGGDEFLVVCPQVASPDAVLDLASRIHSAVSSSLGGPGGHLSCGASIGVAWIAERSVTAEEAAARADAAMYAAKRSRRQEPVLWSPSAPIDEPEAVGAER